MIKNKFFPLFLSACLLFTLSACGKNQNKAFELLTRAAAKTEGLQTIHVQTEENYSMSAAVSEDEHEENKVLASVTNTEMTAKRSNDKLEAFTAKASMTLWGFTMASEIYYKDGQLYTSSMDGKVKMSDPKEKDLEPYYRVLQYLSGSKEMLYRAEITENENSTEISTVFAGNEFKQEMVDFLPDHYFETINSNPDYFNQLNFSDVTAKYTLRNGYISEFQTSFILEITIDGKATSVSYRYSLKILNPGNEEELVYPENLDEYQELS